jgi:uncharacterized protein (TIGR02145 family)
LESDDEYDGEVEYVEDLPNCTAKKDEKVYYVEAEDFTYTCRYDEGEDAGEWVRKKKKVVDGRSSSSSAKSDGPVVIETMTDERDGQIYKIVKIGDQVWMAENLKFRYLGPTANEDSSSFCIDGDPANCDTYGRLYLWSAAMDSAGIIKGNAANGCGFASECIPSEPVRGVCPQGWHLPDTTEWIILFNAVGGSSTAGIKLKTTTGWRNDGNGTDDFGFSALPAGYRTNNGAYNLKGDHTYFWNSTEFNKFYVYYTGLYSSGDYAKWSVNTKSGGYSVRCLRD